ncbi:MFS transporter [Histidinibacterium lentulum]|uniref:MFS transporter n=1 Tax=Histidinibacterium lentulum TaxID=2480588 RepID=A0A3N2R119_9RHOB|nr:MFS transporter [Histidinibacterium lentulum]ROU01171.1 MFS transporter [Histidinibacterium lentulum]
MRQPLRLILGDPTLRMSAAAVALFGALVASVTPYQSLVAIRLFDLSDGAYAAILVAAALVSVGGAVAAGIATDRTTARKRVALGSALLLVAGYGAVLVAPGPVTFVLAHAVLLPAGGALMGQLFALARLATSTTSARDRDSVLAAIRALFAVPFLVVLPLWAVAFDRGAGLLAIYGAMVPVSLGLLALILRAWPPDGHGRWTETRSGLSSAASLREMAAPGVLVRVALTGGIMSGVFVYMIVLGLVFDESTGRDLGDVALFAGLIAGLEVPVMLGIGQLLRILSRMQAIALGAMTYAGFLFVFPILLPSPLVWLLTIPAALGAGIILSLPIGYVQDLMGDRAGAGGALLALQKVAGDAVAAVVFAGAAWWGGYAAAAVMAGLAMLAATAALLWLDRRSATAVPR